MVIEAILSKLPGKSLILDIRMRRALLREGKSEIKIQWEFMVQDIGLMRGGSTMTQEQGLI